MKNKKTNETWNKPKAPKFPKYPDELEVPVDFPLKSDLSIKLYGKAKLKIHKDIIKAYGWNWKLLVRGEMTETYSPLTEKGADFLKEFLVKMSKADNKRYTNLRQVDADSYETYYSFRVHQVLEAKEVEVK